MAHTRLIIIALCAIAAMSSAPVLIKATTANEVTVAFSRLGIALLAFSPLAIWQGKLWRLSLTQWLQLLLIGLVFAVHWLSYFISIKVSTSSVAALAITTYGVQYMLLAWLFNGERISKIDCLAVACCFAGCLIVSPSLSFDDDSSRGMAVGLFSALLYAVLPLLHQRASSIPTLERTWGQFFFALLFFLPLWPRSDWNLTQADVYQLLMLGLLCTVIAHGLWVKTSTELPALYSSMIYYLYLPLAMIGSLVFLGEEITLQKLFGAALVVGSSIALSIYRFHRYRKT
ncbi:DMT family transporter [Parahaliea sp. F7430]|uniref:DMT family transporter n=1 Tax=Sediminihaliea albiluteola TaxID=2758564 RepID=A0A7W2TWP1_9GAMM|nr:DMT family transporter [Sediminihaliea albiluteola]MBA6413340.1 DMT family transporter [Sediminihaliea albiluteola]